MLSSGPHRSDGSYLTPRFHHDFDQQRAWHLREPNQHGRVVAIVLREKEGARIELHKDLALGNCPQLQHQDRLVVAESREETTIQKEGGHAIRSPFCDARQP